MEGMCGFRSMDDYSDKALMSPESLMMQNDYSDQSPMFSGHYHRNISPFGSERGSGTFQSSAISESTSIATEIHHQRYRRSAKQGQVEKYDDEDTCRGIKAKIASHPLYPRLLHAYIECQKVGAPPEIAGLLDEMKQENGFCRRDGAVASIRVGADPELDDFMETYCDVLVKYKSDLERPFDEATTFLNKIEMQLGNLGKGIRHVRVDDGGVSYTSDDDVSGGGGGENIEDEELNVGNEEERELKERLLRKYGDHLSALKLEFSKKKKKGKLPKDARQTLLQWWNIHYRWPYPTEADKIYLAETTGLDQKQINNWFINQRKRHWKPSENIQLAVMANCSQQFFTDD